MIFREQRKAIWWTSKDVFRKNLLKVISFYQMPIAWLRKDIEMILGKGLISLSRWLEEDSKTCQLAFLPSGPLSQVPNAISFDSTTLSISRAHTVLLNLLIFIFFRYPFVMCVMSVAHWSEEEKKRWAKKILPGIESSPPPPSPLFAGCCRSILNVRFRSAREQK